MNLFFVSDTSRASSCFFLALLPVRFSPFQSSFSASLSSCRLTFVSFSFSSSLCFSLSLNYSRSLSHPAINNNGPFWFFAALMFFFVVGLGNILNEKENKLREIMKIMGLYVRASSVLSFSLACVFSRFSVLSVSRCHRTRRTGSAGSSRLPYLELSP